MHCERAKSLRGMRWAAARLVAKDEARSPTSYPTVIKINFEFPRNHTYRIKKVFPRGRPFQSRWSDLNRRPVLYESTALATELQRQATIHNFGSLAKYNEVVAKNQVCRLLDLSIEQSGRATVAYWRHRLLLDARHVATVARVDSYQVALIDKHGHLHLVAGFQFYLFAGRIGCVTGHGCFRPDYF